MSLSTLKSSLKESIDLYADVILNPAFLQADIDRLKRQHLAGIASSRQDPARLASRLGSTLLFGKDHPYGRLTTEADVEAIDRDAVAAFHARWFHPENATLIVTGDTTLAEIRPLVEAAFAGWKRGTVPEVIVPESAGPDRSVVYLVDMPGAPQTVIRASVVAPARREGDAIAREALNSVVGGSFTSRLNMKLREEKGWAYGAGSSIRGGRGAQMFAAGASVQVDKTAESMVEIAKTIEDMVGPKPVDVHELAATRDEMSLGLTGAWATSAGIASHLMDQEIYGLPEDYYANYPRNVAKVPLDIVHAEADTLFRGRPLTWLVVGDRARIEASIKALNLGEVRVVDADGNVI